jgi:hypothetical protein
MINDSNILLIVLIGVLIIALLMTNKSSRILSSTTKNNSAATSPKFEEYNTVINDVISFDDNKSTFITKESQNPNFINIQFHNDYRDVTTAFNNIIPERNQRFNLANIPLVYSEPDPNNSEAKYLIKDFIEVLNKNLINQVPNVRNKNSGWDEAIPDPNMRSGWDKMQNSLGLTSSLYEKPKMGGIIKLISIQLVQKYETEDEIKYLCEIILQKENVQDQIIIKTSFVQDKRPLYDENNFNIISKVELRVIIEDIFIVGYLSKDGSDAKLQYDNDAVKFFNYDDMEQNNMTDPKKIQKILLKKYKQRTQEMQQRNALLDEEGQTFHKDLPNLYDFSNIRSTRTIFDDMNNKKTFV